MLTKLNPEIYNYLVKGTPAQRAFICEQEFAYFALYYFTEYFHYKIPRYHFEMYDDLKRLSLGQLKYVLWIIFREGAKTSLAKIFVIWCICFKKKQYMNWGSYDKGNSEAALFDIVVSLQTNKKLREDFGNLYSGEKIRSTDEAKMKRISNFITENGVKLEAFSTQESTRGRIYKDIRPDLYVFDDIENEKTKRSPAITQNIIDHYDEAMSGLSPAGSILTLGNYITSEGSVAHIRSSLESKENAVVRDVPLVDKEANISWPDKYVWTKKEAAELNQDIEEKYKHKVAIEQLKEDLENFEAEMMNNPDKSEDLYFDRRIVESAIEHAKKFPIVQEKGEMKIWFTYVPGHRYGVGGDTAEGIGADSNTAACIDFSSNPSRVVAVAADNKQGPNVWAYTMKIMGEMYGNCIVAPEVNNTGYATIAELQEIYDNIYTRETKDKTTGQELKVYGWRASQSTVPEVMAQLKSAFESGMLEIYDIGLLEEMKAFKKGDTREFKKKEGMTRHFDKLRACAIAWEMRNHAMPSVQGARGGRIGERDVLDGLTEKDLEVYD